VDLDVVDHFPLHGSLEINNRRSQDTTPLRTSASLSYDDLWQAGHSLSLSAQVDPQKTADARVYYGSYLARFGASPWSLLVSATRSNSNVATIGGTDVLGNGTTVSMQAMLTLTATDTFYQALSFGVAYKHFNNTTTAEETQAGAGHPDRQGAAPIFSPHHRLHHHLARQHLGDPGRPVDQFRQPPMGEQPGRV
jgi:hemolysin activation/secretion protein